jgi:SAM-dependent methyltransferase
MARGPVVAAGRQLGTMRHVVSQAGPHCDKERCVKLAGQDFEMVRHYLASRGLDDGFVSSIHEADEMYSVLVSGMNNAPDRAIVSYFDTGRELWRTVDETLRQAGRDPHSLGSVLEFACGYGRLTRYLIREFSAGQITAVDIQKPAVDFQSKVMGTNAVLSNTDPSKIPLDGPFDLIIVVSLFSHLPMYRFEEWLVRLYELLAPDGLLLFSVHPEDVIEEHRRDPSGFTFKPVRSERNQIANEDPETDLQQYGSTYATFDAVREIAARCGVAHLYCSRKGLVDFQDLYLASANAIPALESWERTRWIKGFIDHAKQLEAGRVCIDGWCVDTARGERMRELRVWVDGQLLEGETRLCQARPDVARAESRPDWVNTGWSITAPMPSPCEGPHLVIAEVDGISFDCGWREFTTG